MNSSKGSLRRWLGALGLLLILHRACFFAAAGASSNQAAAVWLDVSQAYALGSEDLHFPGFQAVSAQIVPGGLTSQIADTRWGDQMLVGLGSNNDANVVSEGSWFKNTDSLGDTNYNKTNGLFSPGEPSSWYWVSNTINFATGPAAGDFTATNGAPDQPFPAIPGTLADAAGRFDENFEVEIKTWLVLPTAGLYTFAINCAGAFRVTEATNHGRLTGVQVSTGTTNYMIPAVPQYPDNGGGIGAFLPTTHLISVPLILGSPMTGANSATNLNNAAAVAGKVVVMQQSDAVDPQQLAWLAAQSGALALVEIGTGPPGDPPNATFAGTNVGIPVLLIGIDDGLALSNSLVTAATVPIASLGDDASPVLAQSQGSTADADTQFQVIVPVPGVYPIRIIYTAGAGEAALEFSQWITELVSSTPEQVLVNDTAHGAVAAVARLLPTAVCDCVIVDPIGIFTSITAIGNQVTIAWTGSARLQQASSVSVPGAAKWTTVTPTPSGHTYTTTATNGSLFFRMIYP